MGYNLAWLGIQSLRFRGAKLEATDPAGSLRRGVIANFLNPSLYLFGLAVGAPTVLAAWREEWQAAAVFIAAFHALLVGSKVLLAMTLGRARQLLGSGGYIVLIRGLGLLLLAYALLFLRESGRLLA